MELLLNIGENIQWHIIKIIKFIDYQIEITIL